MAKDRIRCVTYFRSRADDRHADELARDQQVAAEAFLCSQGYEITARYGDPEFAAPESGWLEPRPAWSEACRRSEEIAAKYGECTLVVLRSDGIGTGDDFLPSPEELNFDFNVSVRIFGSRFLPTKGGALSEVFAQGDRLSVREQCSSVISCSDNAPYHEISFKFDPALRMTRAYFNNHSARAMEVAWQEKTRPLFSDGRWTEPSSWEHWEVPPKSAVQFCSVPQGQTPAVARNWRFREGNGRATKVGNVVFTQAQVVQAGLKLSWYPFEPAPLKETDFHWLDRPSLSTRRLNLRNWKSSDTRPYAAACNTEEVMHFLGGVQSDRALAEDISYFSELGKVGPTYWIVERRADNTLLGFCGAIVVEEQDSPIWGETEIGWRLRKGAWGRGYAYEAAAEVLRCLFDELAVKSVLARIDARNHSSRRVAERLGMTENERLRHAGDDQQVLHVYEIDETAYSYSRMNRASLGLP